MTIELEELVKLLERRYHINGRIRKQFKDRAKKTMGMINWAHLKPALPNVGNAKLGGIAGVDQSAISKWNSGKDAPINEHYKRVREHFAAHLTTQSWSELEPWRFELKAKAALVNFLDRKVTRFGAGRQLSTPTPEDVDIYVLEQFVKRPEIKASTKRSEICQDTISWIVEIISNCTNAFDARPMVCATTNGNFCIVKANILEHFEPVKEFDGLSEIHRRAATIYVYTLADDWADLLALTTFYSRE